jgi:hypothetical protein
VQNSSSKKYKFSTRVRCVPRFENYKLKKWFCQQG